MKLRPLLTLCAALLALSPGPATAQTTSAVPNFISYQGRVVDAAGNNVGAGTPVNRTVIFRIWDTPSATTDDNLIYSEAQTVTISEGEFSVLVGQGVTNTTQTYGYSESDKKLSDFGTAFNGSARYLGVTVAAATTIALTDNEITPRQQIVSTAFAMRAKVAESVYANAISSTMLATGAVGSTQLAGASVTSDKLGVAAVLTANIGNFNVTTDKIDNLAVTTVKIDGNAVDNTKLRDSVGLSVIGRTSSTTGDPADIVAATEGHVLRRSGTRVGFGTIGTAGIAKAAITGEKIAIDTAITAAQLTATNRVMTASLEFLLPPAGTFGALFKAGSPGLFPTNTSATAGDMVLLGSPRLHLATANGGAAVMTLSGADVGIGTTTPTKGKLHIEGSKSVNPGTISYASFSNSNFAAPAWSVDSGNGAESVSLYASGAIWSQTYVFLSSDRRIKENILPVEGSRSLKILRSLDSKYYDYKDKLAMGGQTNVGFIAQEVKEVLPEAVSMKSQFVPSEMRTLQDMTWSALEDGRWKLTINDLDEPKSGQLYRFYMSPDKESTASEGEAAKEKMLEVASMSADPKSFVFDRKYDRVFLYGKQVDDFLTLKNDMIWAIAYTALKEVDRQQQADGEKIEALQGENAALRRELAAQQQTMETRLIALERQMAQAGTTETVSLKTTQVAK